MVSTLEVCYVSSVIKCRGWELGVRDVSSIMKCRECELGLAMCGWG
jgi:hypothetical protein